MSNFQLSLIIPTFNEEKYLSRLLDNIRFQDLFSQVEIIVVDANSADKTKEIAEKQADVVLSTSIRNRAHQMNLGAKKATTNLLYFLPAYVIPPNRFIEIILENHQNGSKVGCFRQKFEENSPLMKINSFFTRFNFSWCRGEDQTLFVDQFLFEQLNGYNESFTVLEIYDFLNRAKKLERFSPLEQSAIVTMRKHSKYSWFRVQFVLGKAKRMYLKGADPAIIDKMFRKLLDPS